ncbi:MAG: PilZ domain-containing protein [Candidatus Omnitrophica bacterium]|nr:PilZ domain-containing protein [Candidatus Omnitrophota bacterium]
MERRAHPRFKWRFILRCREEKKGTEACEFTTVENISKGGCLFPSNRPFPVGEVLELQIKFPDRRDFLVFKGEVKRCEEIKTISSYWIAVEFKELFEEGKQELEKYFSISQKQRSEK